MEISTSVLWSCNLCAAVWDTVVISRSVLDAVAATISSTPLQVEEGKEDTRTTTHLIHMIVGTLATTANVHVRR